MSSSTLPPTTLDAKYVGTFGSLAALTGAVTAPVIGDTATLIDSAGATGGGVAGVKRKVYWSGGSWVVFDEKLHASLNSATLITDASRVAIANVSPSADNLAGITEYRSSRSVNFSVQDGIVQANLAPAGVYTTTRVNQSLPFGTVTFMNAASVAYNTLDAVVALTPIGITIPFASRYEVVSNWRNLIALTTTSDGFVFFGRTMNGIANSSLVGQTNSSPSGVSFTADNVESNRNSFVMMSTLPAGNVQNVIAYQTVVATYFCQGVLSVGVRQE